MNFERLRYLAAVARTGSVRGAASALSVTPGAVSKALVRLEEEAGVPLMVRSGRGVELTQDGRWLANRASYLAGEHASLTADLSDRMGRESGMCIATYDSLIGRLPALLARQYLPGVPLSVRERWPGELEDTVAAGVSDVGVTLLPVQHPDVQHREVARIKLGVFVSCGAFAKVAVNELPFVVASHPVTGAMSSYGPLDGWPVDAPPRNIVMRSSAFEARLDAARAGVGALLAPTFAIARHNEMVGPEHRLEPWSGTVPTGLSRRVYLVTRTHSSSLLQQRQQVVASAVAALCST